MQNHSFTADNVHYSTRFTCKLIYNISTWHRVQNIPYWTRRL